MGKTCPNSTPGSMGESGTGKWEKNILRKEVDDMPAKKKITREAIIEGALNTLRDGGYDSVNARSVAKKLGCSTQPIYLEFENMDELRIELTKCAISTHTQMVMDVMDRNHEDNNRYRSYGIGFVNFAWEEKQLFRYLYLEGNQNGEHLDDAHLDQIMDIMEEQYGYPRETAKLFHQDMMFYVYGVAVLANKGSIEPSQEEIEELLNRQFKALVGVYGIPPKFPTDWKM